MGATTRPLLSSFVRAPVVNVQAVDESVRAFAAQHFQLAGHAGVGYDSPAGQALSALAPVALVAAAAVSAALIAKVSEGQRGKAVSCVAALFSVHTLVLLPLVELGIKPAVHRLRPDTLHHHSFSFPSGHTSSATFVSGALFLVIVPLLLDALSAERPSLRQPSGALVALWVATAIGTGLGRILADAHWFSDTVAGATLGAALLAATVSVLERQGVVQRAEGGTAAAGLKLGSTDDSE